MLRPFRISSETRKIGPTYSTVLPSVADAVVEPPPRPAVAVDGPLDDVLADVRGSGGEERVLLAAGTSFAEPAAVVRMNAGGASGRGKG